ncbi:hypothetical protein C1645_770711, partial [Glomus cerebriforme]
MTNIIEESFDISKCQRLSHITGKKGSSRIKQFEDQTGAGVRIINEQTTTILIISGNSSQLREAKILIRDFLERTSFVPTICYFILAESGLNNNSKLKFVKYNETMEINDDDGDNDDDDDDVDPLNESKKIRYYVEFLQPKNKTDEVDINRPEDFSNLIIPYEFNTFDNIDYCLERLSLKIKATFKKSFTFPSKNIIKSRIFIGKLLFFNLNNPEDHFILQEWYRINFKSTTGILKSVDDCFCDDNEIYNSKSANNEFHQISSKIYNNFNIIQEKFGFKLDDNKKIINNKGSINIYYTPYEHKKRKLKLSWCEKENKWKVVKNAHGLNRLANIDIISGSKAPDFRFSIKTHYDLPSNGSKVEEVINEIQSAQTFTERDGMWFRSKDFSGTIIKKALVRQVIEKKRFRNENFNMILKTIKQDNCNIITTQKLIILEHRFWNKEINLDNSDEFMNSIIETFHFTRKMMNDL